VQCEKYKLNYDGGESGSKKNHTMLWWRVWCDLAESEFGGSLESGGRFCYIRLVSVAVKMF
jgi:hypothetical protein